MPQTCTLQSPHAFDLVCLVCPDSPACDTGKHKEVCLGVSVSQYRAGFKVTMWSEDLVCEEVSCHQHVLSVWPAGRSLSLEKHSPSSTPVRLNLRDLYLSPSACQGPCAE